ncbi:MAG: response regulator transcription factor [Gammaproteobacteria bacterium]|nr:response regulator transcription factor [Gammaproteobacteria bacterium]
MRLLIVEDDELLGDGLQAVLQQRGHTVDWVQDGITADHALRREYYDLAILDLQLPNMSGQDILNRLRTDSKDIPVLILTARSDLDDRVNLLNSGADDYVVKPFEMDELCARIQALHRRNKGLASPQIRIDSLCLDPQNHSVTVDERQVNLSSREFSVLQLLMENKGRVISRAQIEEALYGWGDEVESNAVEVHIHHLRKKLKINPIRTIRGVGYIIG